MAIGFMKKLFSGGNSGDAILCPVEGEVVSITEVSDPTFGEEILGKGVAIKPAKGRVVSPVDGTIALMFDTGHAVSIMADNGAEILVHIGIDTVKLNGQFYTVHAKNGDKVKAGDLLLEFDIAGIEGAGYQTITPVVVCNTADYAEVQTMAGKQAKELDEIIRLKK